MFILLLLFIIVISVSKYSPQFPNSFFFVFHLHFIKKNQHLKIYSDIITIALRPNTTRTNKKNIYYSGYI